MSILPGLNWTAAHDVFIGQITEIDMASAGLSVIKSERLLPANFIARLESLPKDERSIAIGKLSLKKEFKDVAMKITDGIRYRMGAVLDLNGIGLDRLLSVKRDAVFVTGPAPSKLRLPDGTMFAIKSSFSSFAKLGTVEVYAAPRRKIVELKGIGKEKRHLHDEYCTRFISDVLLLIERNNLRDAAATIQLFRRNYVERMLPEGFYREFNAQSTFVQRFGSMFVSSDTVGSGIDFRNLEIAYNIRNVITPLARFLA